MSDKLDSLAPRTGTTQMHVKVALSGLKRALVPVY